MALPSELHVAKPVAARRWRRAALLIVLRHGELGAKNWLVAGGLSVSCLRVAFSSPPCQQSEGCDMHTAMEPHGTPSSGRRRSHPKDYIFCPASQTSDKDAKRPGSADAFQCSCIDVQSAHLVDLRILIHYCSPLRPMTRPRSSKHTWLQGAAHSSRFPSRSKGCRRLWPRERMGALTVQRPEQLQRQYPC